MNCILHIGMPKTGSASLQKAFFSQRTTDTNTAQEHISEILSVAKTRIFSYEDKTINKRRANAGRIFKQLIGVKDDISLSLFKDEISKMQGISNLIISAEILGEPFRKHNELCNVRDFLKTYFDEIRVVLYVRDPVTWVPARIQQAIKTGHEINNNYLRRYINSSLITNSTRRILDIFSSENVLIRGFDKDLLIKGDIRHDFIQEVIGVKLTEDQSKNISVMQANNFSLTIEMTNLIARVYKDLKINHKNNRIKFISKISNQKWLGQKFGLCYFNQDIASAVYKAAKADRESLRELLGWDPFPSASDRFIVRKCYSESRRLEIAIGNLNRVKSLVRDEMENNKEILMQCENKPLIHKVNTLLNDVYHMANDSVIEINQEIVNTLILLREVYAELKKQ